MVEKAKEVLEKEDRKLKEGFENIEAIFKETREEISKLKPEEREIKEKALEPMAEAQLLMAKARQKIAEALSYLF
jgi:hypothetical protein